jgi:hypothetical protein
MGSLSVSLRSVTGFHIFASILALAGVPAVGSILAHHFWRFSTSFVPDVLNVAGVYAIVGFLAVFFAVAVSAPVVFCVHFDSFLAIAGVQHTSVT